MAERKKVYRKAFSILIISLLLFTLFSAFAVAYSTGDTQLVKGVIWTKNEYGYWESPTTKDIFTDVEITNAINSGSELSPIEGSENVRSKYQVSSETASWCSKDADAQAAGFFKSRLCLWFWGYDAKTQESLPAIVEIIKYFLLMIVFILIYSSLSYADFPEKAWLRFLLAAPTAFLATFFISQQEILAMMISYSALGVTFSVFLPIMILAFFTLAVAKKASPMGIYIQKIVWLIYSLYLFFKSGFGLLASGLGGIDMKDGKFWGMDISSTLAYFQGNIKPDPVMLLILFITSIAVFVIMVLGNKYVFDWLAKEAREAEVEAKKSELDRSHAFTSLTAQQMEDQKKVK